MFSVDNEISPCADMPTYSASVQKLHKHLRDLLTPTTTPTDWMKMIQKSLYATRTDPIFIQMRLLHLLYDTKLEIKHDKHTIVLNSPTQSDLQTQTLESTRKRPSPHTSVYSISCEPRTSGVQKRKTYEVKLKIAEKYSSSVRDSITNRIRNPLKITEHDSDKHNAYVEDNENANAKSGPIHTSTAPNGVLLIIDLNSILHYSEACIPIVGDSQRTHVSEYRELSEPAHPNLLPSVSRLLYKSTDEAMLALTPDGFEKLHTRVCHSLRIDPGVTWTITSNVDMGTLSATVTLYSCRRTEDILIWTNDDAFYRCLDRNLLTYFTTQRLESVPTKSANAIRPHSKLNRIQCLQSNRSLYACVFVSVHVTPLTNDIARGKIDDLSSMCRLNGIRCLVLNDSSTPPRTLYQSLQHPCVIISRTSLGSESGPYANYIFMPNQMVVLDPAKCPALVFKDIIDAATTPVDPPRDMRLIPVIKSQTGCSDRVYTIYPVDNIITKTPLFVCARASFACTSLIFNFTVKVMSADRILLYEWYYNSDHSDVTPEYYFVAHSPPGMERMFELLWACIAGESRTKKNEQHSFEAQLRYNVQAAVTQPVKVFVTPMCKTQLQLQTDRHYALYVLPTSSPPVHVHDLMSPHPKLMDNRLLRIKV
jgi:hypothetical protein